MTSFEVIDVDENGLDAEGDGFEHAAHEWAVSQGLMTNEPVLIRYPNGDMKAGNRVRITQLGLYRIAHEMGKGQ